MPKVVESLTKTTETLSIKDADTTQVSAVGVGIGAEHCAMISKVIHYTCGLTPSSCDKEG